MQQPLGYMQFHICSECSVDVCGTGLFVNIITAVREIAFTPVEMGVQKLSQLLELPVSTTVTISAIVYYIRLPLLLLPLQHYWSSSHHHYQDYNHTSTSTIAIRVSFPVLILRYHHCATMATVITAY